MTHVLLARELLFAVCVSAFVLANLARSWRAEVVLPDVDASAWHRHFLNVAFALGYVTVMVVLSAGFPELNDGQSERQRQLHLLISRGGTCILVALMVEWARQGITAAAMLPIEPRHTGGRGTRTLAVSAAMLRGELPLQPSLGIRLSCALHTAAHELIFIAVSLLCLQPTAWMRRRFRVWAAIRAGALALGLNDAALLACIVVYLRCLAANVGTSAGHEGEARVRLLFERLAVLMPAQLVVASFTAKRRHRLASFARRHWPWNRKYSGATSVAATAAEPRSAPVCHMTSAAADLADAEAAASSAEVDVAACAADGAEPDELQDDHDRRCVVCLDAPPTHTLAPCGHQCACAECAAILTECPLCRRPVVAVVAQVFQL